MVWREGGARSGLSLSYQITPGPTTVNTWGWQSPVMSRYLLILFLPLISVSARLDLVEVEITSPGSYEEEREDFTTAVNNVQSKQQCTKVGYIGKASIWGKTHLIYLCWGFKPGNYFIFRTAIEENTRTFSGLLMITISTLVRGIGCYFML